MKFGIVKLSVRWMSRQPPARAEIPTATRSAGNVLRLMSNTLLERAGARRPTRSSREFDARQYTAPIGWESMITVGGRGGHEPARGASRSRRAVEVDVAGPGSMFNENARKGRSR